MGASCSRRLMSYILHSRNSDDSGACDTQFSLQTSFRRLGILGVPLSFKARRLSIDKGEIEGKGATVPNLLDACIAHFAKSLQHVDAATLDRIPNELIQKIFDDLVEQQRLDGLHRRQQTSWLPRSRRKRRLLLPPPRREPT